MATLFFEGFETDGAGVRYSTTPTGFTDGSGDFFTQTDGTNIGSFYSVTGGDGSGFFGIQDTDGEPPNADIVTLDITGIDISGATNLMFSGLFAEDDSSDGNEDWDANSLVYVEAQIDGGGYVKLLQFASGGATNTQPGLDTDFDGIADGAALTDVFASFSAAIAGAGTTLDLRITAENLDAGDEDIAFDALTVTADMGGSGPVTVLDETFDDDSKFSSSTGFFSDGSATTWA